VQFLGTLFQHVTDSKHLQPLREHLHVGPFAELMFDAISRYNDRSAEEVSSIFWPGIQTPSGVSVADVENRSDKASVVQSHEPSISMLLDLHEDANTDADTDDSELDCIPGMYWNGVGCVGE
jgi:hypothetical protein